MTPTATLGTLAHWFLDQGFTPVVKPSRRVLGVLAAMVVRQYAKQLASAS